MANIGTVEIGDRVVVRVGEKGEQFAVIVALPSSGTMYARKWLGQGARWTNRVRLWQTDLLRFANEDDIRKRKPDLGKFYLDS